MGGKNLFSQLRKMKKERKKIYQISFKAKIQQKITFFIESTNLFAFIKI